MMKQNLGGAAVWFCFIIHTSAFIIGQRGKGARVTAAIAKQTTVAAFRPSRDL